MTRIDDHVIGSLTIDWDWRIERLTIEGHAGKGDRRRLQSPIVNAGILNQSSMVRSPIVNAGI